MGSPLCVGHGPLVFRFEIEGKQMGLVCSRAILADVPSGGSIFRLVSAVKMKRHGFDMYPVYSMSPIISSV